jgi:hypothetical protein
LGTTAKKLSTKNDWDKRWVDLRIGKKNLANVSNEHGFFFSLTMRTIGAVLAGGGMPPLLCIFKSESEARRGDAIESATTVMVLGAKIGVSQLESRDKVPPFVRWKSPKTHTHNVSSFVTTCNLLMYRLLSVARSRFDNL